MRNQEFPPGPDTSFRTALPLYLRLVLASIRARMQYRFDFLINLGLYGLVNVIDFLLVAAILARFRFLQGWSVYEVGLLFAIASIAMSLYQLLAPEIHHFERYIILGEFDGLLIRPWSSLFILLTRNVDLVRLGGVLQGGIILFLSVTALARAGVLGPRQILILLLLPWSGMLIFLSLGLATAALAFWLGRIDEFQVFTLYAPQNAVYYPLTIYPRWLQGVLFGLLPVAFVNYVPIRYILGKGGSPWDLLLTPLVALFSLLLALRLWEQGEKHYTSTGS